MLKNPIHLRLAHLTSWQQITFMACLCERMYPNYALFCRQTSEFDEQKYKQLLDMVWESLLVKAAKIDFERQLDKLEVIIPLTEAYERYSVYPAIDACQALGELFHGLLCGETLDYAITVSEISLNTVANLEMTQQGCVLDEAQLKILPSILEELDLQWEIYRVLRASEGYDLELIKGLRADIRESQISNIGVFLSN